MDNSKALAILEKNRGISLVFARREEIEAVSPQYEPIVTVLELSPADFTDVGMGNMYPGKSATNRISDAAGVSFLHNVGGTREVGSWSTVKAVKQAGGFFQAVGEYKIIGVAQGQRLKPDGTPRLSSVREYEFNVVDRANEDFLKDFQKGSQAKYTSEVAALKHLLELKKFATQRASTGAELAVIRELVGMPTAFKADQIGKPLVFSQIVENSHFKVEIAREIMKTPDGRQAVVNALFGTAAALYGPQPQAALPPGAEKGNADPAESARQVGFEPDEAPPAKQPQSGTDFDFDGGEPDPFAETEPKVDSEVERLQGALAEYIAAGCLRENGKKACQDALDRGETDVIILRDLVSKAKAAYDARMRKGAAI
jgi:hypothetical protein